MSIRNIISYLQKCYPTTPAAAPAPAGGVAAPAVFSAPAPPAPAPAPLTNAQEIAANIAALAAIQPILADSVKPIDQPASIIAGLPALGLPSVTKFRIFDPELLLEQAAGFLDRCLASRREWDALNEKRFSTHVGLWAAAQEELMRQKEEAAGLYTNPDTITAIQLAAETEQVGDLVEAHKYYIALEDLATTKKLPSTPETQARVFESATGNYQNEAQRVASQGRKDVLDVTKNWTAANIQFQQDRAAISNSVLNAKQTAFSAGGGAYDFQSQMDSLRKRFVLDACEALLRLQTAAEGLAPIYNYKEALPQAVTEILKNIPVTGRVFLDDAVAWTQLAMSWLLRFSRLDQPTVVTVSIKKQMGAGWETGKTSATPGEARWVFKIDDPKITTATHVRIRGISAYAVKEKAPLGIWQGAVGVPKMGKILYRDGTTGQIKQDSLPTVAIGRIGRRIDGRAVDVFGSAALCNASPISAIGSEDWTFTMTTQSTQGEDDFTDIELDLYLAIQR